MRLQATPWPSKGVALLSHIGVYSNTTLPLGSLVCLSFQQTPDATQTTLGFTDHRSGEVWVGHTCMLTSACLSLALGCCTDGILVLDPSH